jgi:hypothetical protein
VTTSLVTIGGVRARRDRARCGIQQRRRVVQNHAEIGGCWRDAGGDRHATDDSARDDATERAMARKGQI